jgi:hypothetical protein
LFTKSSLPLPVPRRRRRAPYVTKYFKVPDSQNLILTDKTAFEARVTATLNTSNDLGFYRNLAGLRAAMRRQPGRAACFRHLRRRAPYVTKCF